MTFREIIDREDQNEDSIWLYREGTGEPITTNISLIWFNNSTEKADTFSDICQMNLPGMKFKSKLSRQETTNHRNGSYTVSDSILQRISKSFYVINLKK